MDDEPFSRAGQLGNKFARGRSGTEVIADAGEPLGPVPPRGQMFRVLRQVGCHLLAGRWARAHIVLTTIEQELEAELAAPDFASSSVTAKRQRFLAELPMDQRLVNTLEGACFFTVGEVHDAWPDDLAEMSASHIITNFGPVGIVNVGLALVAWGLLRLERVQQWAARHSDRSVTAADVPAIDRLGRPLKRDDE
jgi:hypothetical protein